MCFLTSETTMGTVKRTRVVVRAWFKFNLEIIFWLLFAATPDCGQRLAESVGKPFIPVDGGEVEADSFQWVASIRNNSTDISVLSSRQVSQKNSFGKCIFSFGILELIGLWLYFNRETHDRSKVFLDSSPFSRTPSILPKNYENKWIFIYNQTKKGR